jgi:hypothetical protein
MAVRLLFTIADNAGHLLSMRYLVLSPFPPSNGDHVDPFGPKTHFFQFQQDPRPCAASSLLDQLRRQANPLRNAEDHVCARLAQPPRVPADRSCNGNGSSLSARLL